MDMTQLTLRVSRELSERIKSHAKAIKKPVNTFLTHAIENALNTTHAETGVDELTSLLSDPFKSLAGIHYKISDPWDTHEEVELSSAEKEFLLEGARKQLDTNDLRWPFYEEVREKITDKSNCESYDFLRLIFGFALSYYISDEQARYRFASKQTPADIPTTTHRFNAGAFTLSIVIKGNEGPFVDSSEINRPPALQLIVETQRFDSRFDWDIFIALTRLMQAVYSGQSSRCHKGGLVRLSRRADDEHPWYLYLGKLQLLLTENELSEIASSLINLVENDAASSIKQMRLLYGES